MNREELLDQLTQDILGYVMAGDFPEREFAQSVKPSELDSRFNDYQLLLDLHFILREDVVTFVEALPQRLRRIRTETESSLRTTRGGIDGRIDWGATIKQRSAKNPRDRSLFAVENRTIDFDIPENIVLIELLSIVYHTLREAEEYIRREYTWVERRWRENGELIDRFYRIMERNVHVSRIREPEAYEPTERMLTTAESARQVVYREAAALLRARDRLFAGDEAEIQKLLETTAIAPDDQDTLFELFVLFRFVSTLDTLRDRKVTFESITSGRQEVARLPGEPEIVLYHDTSAGDRNLSFKTEEAAKLEAPLPRAQKVQETAHAVAESYFQTEYSNHTGRPDVIVLEVRDEANDSYEYLITEVKNSKREKTIRQGIKETLEYLAFLRVNEEYVFEKSEAENGYFGSGWNGLLVVQDLEKETEPFDEQENSIRILQAAELEDQIGTVLEELGIR